MSGFTWVGGRPALDLCNTGGPAERLAAPADLVEWMAAADLVTATIAVGDRDLAEVRALRAALRPALLAADGPAVAALAEGWLAHAPGCLAVDPRTLETRFRPAEATCRCLMVPIVLDALDLVRGFPGRVRECAAEDCTAVYLDTSRNRSRRWCSMERCGARSKAAAYYLRRRQA